MHSFESLTPTEYSFENGFKQVFEEIEKLAENQEYIVVSIIGAGTEVGKTTTAAYIQNELARRHISYSMQNDIDTFSFPPVFTHEESSARVIIFQAERPPALAHKKGVFNKTEAVLKQDQALQRRAAHLGLPIEKIDIRVFVYGNSKDFTPNQKLCANIVIRNDKAQDRSDVHRSRHTQKQRALTNKTK